jgi:hypothetical protein
MMNRRLQTNLWFTMTALTASNVLSYRSLSTGLQRKEQITALQRSQ